MRARRIKIPFMSGIDGERVRLKDKSARKNSQTPRMLLQNMRLNIETRLLKEILLKKQKPLLNQKSQLLQRVIKKIWFIKLEIVKEDEPIDLNCKLPEELKNLGKLLFDTENINSQLKEFGYDSTKLQLHKLPKTSFTKAYQILREIMDALRTNNKKELNKHYSEFYGTIPHELGTE